MVIFFFSENRFEIRFDHEMKSNRCSQSGSFFFRTRSFFFFESLTDRWMILFQSLGAMISSPRVIFVTLEKIEYQFLFERKFGGSIEKTVTGTV